MGGNLVSWSATQLCLFAFIFTYVLAADDVTTTPPPSYKKLYEEVLTCPDAGFKGAFLNDCGYCVQGATGLPRDFGRDCAGTCGQAYVDCAGKCNGESYIDECDGKCIGESSTLNPLESRSALGPANTSKRDCRGLCPLPKSVYDNSSKVFANDGCGICIAFGPLERSAMVMPQPQTVPLNNTSNNSSRMSSTGTGVNSTGNSTLFRGVRDDASLPKSNYRDCSATCFNPATVHLMAQNNSETCNQCWGPKSSSMGLLDLKDECGHCRSERRPCQCPLVYQDLCGVCNGTNDGCVTIISASPTVIPSDTAVTIKIYGVALQNRHSTFCMLIRKDIGPDGKDEDRFPAVVMGVNISCEVTLPTGLYEIRLAVLNTADDYVVSMSNTSFPFVVYSKSAQFNTMTPYTVVLNDKVDNFTVHLIGQDLDRLDNVYCTIQEGYGSGYFAKVKSSLLNNSSTNCTFPMPSKSFYANVTISLDDNNTFAGPFPIRLVAPPPYVTDSYIFHDGDSVMIFFNRHIRLSYFKNNNCGDYLTPSTVEMLGPNTTCIWVTKQQLLIDLGPSVTGLHALPEFNTTINTTETAISIVFQDNVLMADNEYLAETARGFEISFYMSDELPIAVLSGPSQVPPCGKFTLDGHQSIKVQNRRVRYQWDVDTPGTNKTTQALLDAIEDANLKNTAWLTLEAEMLESDVPYEFTLTVNNGPSENKSLNEMARSNVATLNVTKSLHLVPLVVMEPSLASYPGVVNVDDSFSIRSYVTTPTCQHEIFAMSYNWSFSNPRIKVNLKQIDEHTYKIVPYSLPVGEKVTINLLVTLNNDKNMSSEASITFTTAPSSIKALVGGGFRRVIGNGAGTLILNASKSYYPDKPSLPLVYRWECSEEGGNPCYDYDVNSGQILLVPQPVTRDPVLRILTKKLKSDKKLNFTLTVLSPLDSNVYSEPSIVMVSVVNGTTPLVSINSLMPYNELVTKPDMEDMVHLIPAMADIIATATVNSSVPIQQLEWFIDGQVSNISTQMTNNSISDQITESTIIISKDFLISKGLYVLGLKVRDIYGNQGEAYESFTILPSVSDCVVNVPDYEAFKMVMVTVDNCTADDASYPLSYQVHVYKGSQLISLSPPQLHQPLDIMGPPDMLNSNGTSGTIIFSVKICDSIDNCHWFNSTTVRVSAASDLQATAEHAFFMANIAKLQGDFVACVRRHILYLEAVTIPYRFRHEMEYESQLAETFICARMAAEEQCADSNCFDELFTFLTSITFENSPGRDFILMEVVERAINRMSNEGIILSPVGAQQVFHVLENIYNFNVSNEDITNRVTSAQAAILKILARSLRLGQSSVLTDLKGRLMAALSYSLLNETLVVSLFPGTNSNQTVKLRFDDAVRETYKNWQCQENSSVCHGFIVEMLAFPNKNLLSIYINKNRTVSEVVEVVFLNPATGNRLQEKNWITVILMANQSLLNADLRYKCNSWNAKDEEWTTDDVTTDVVNDTIFYCGSNYPGYFAVIGADKTLSAAEIVGIVLGVLGGVALIGLVAFFFYKKARTKTMRVSISKGYHPNQ